MSQTNWFGFPGDLPPPIELTHLVVGKWVSQAISVVAELDVAGRLAAGSQTSAELAAQMGVDEDALYRQKLPSLRSLSSSHFRPRRCPFSTSAHR